MSTTPEAAGARNVVLVHGGFVDGSGWRGVYDLLRADGYTVTVVQNPTLSLDGDVATTQRALDAQDGPTVLGGHSYGGAVISEAGNHPRVSALVYIAAFAPDKAESVDTLIADPPPGAPVPLIVASDDGYLFLDRDEFAASFAEGLLAADARFLADCQVPWGPDALSGTVTEPAWHTRPTYYLIATDDHMIPLPAQRAMAERAGATSPRPAPATPSSPPGPTTSPHSSRRRRRIEGVSQKMLTQTLRALERDGLVTREAFPTVPVTVQYSLTSMGASLSATIQGIRTWAYTHIDQIDTARETYDTQAASASAGARVDSRSDDLLQEDPHALEKTRGTH
ncbi:alpha/beta fold hydrolase [Streptomyces sp. NPDC087850]|uniref:alpha/beta fold hydrolase n=1 Tax=Streptomyces sp. NPDC087850 TaxID=3365809 RepID=UPI0037F4700A